MQIKCENEKKRTTLQGPFHSRGISKIYAFISQDIFFHTEEEKEEKIPR